MGLLQPESGLLFWMCLAFGVVLFLLCKFGFPIILRAIEERKEYIDNSLEEARGAREETLQLRQESRHIIEDAQAQRWRILEGTRAEQEQLAHQLKEKAEKEAAGIIESARMEAQAQKEAILREANEHVVSLAIAVAGKMLMQELKEPQAQERLARKLLDEVNNTQN